MWSKDKTYTRKEYQALVREAGKQLKARTQIDSKPLKTINEGYSKATDQLIGNR